MAARRKVLTLDSVNPHVKGTRLPTLGPLLERASQIQRQLGKERRSPSGRSSGATRGTPTLQAEDPSPSYARWLPSALTQSCCMPTPCHGTPSSEPAASCRSCTAPVRDFLSLVVNEQDPGRAGMLLPVPGHPLYADAVALAGAIGVQYHLDEEGGWVLDVGEIRPGGEQEAPAGCSSPGCPGEAAPAGG
ncbi:alanine aminotransferase 1-like [Natator depressus]|uniref:alanine aminotransferase 1-like n=1 Tax=Natator depressus TaxID=27790 RepID=UPI003EB92EC9